MEISQKNIESLLKKVSAETGAVLSTLYNGWADNLKKYREKPTSANLKNMTSAKNALSSMVAEIEDDQPCHINPSGPMTMVEYGRRIGVTRQRVAAYIKSGQISNSALVEVGKRTKIIPEIADADLDQTLTKNSQSKAAHLASRQEHQPTTTNTINEDTTTKAEADRLKSLAQARHWNVKTAILEGQYVDREWSEMQLAARAIVLKSDMENFFRSRAQEIVAKCDGKQEFAPDLVDYLLTNLEAWLGRYSQPIEFKTNINNVDDVW